MGTKGGRRFYHQRWVSVVGKIIKLPSLQDLMGFLRTETLKLYEEAITQQGTFHIALSGGNSILPFLDMFRDMKLQWEKVHIYQVDERLVPPQSEESNQKLIRDRLCRFVSIPEDNLHFVPITQSPEQSAIEYERMIKESLPERGFDAVVMGLGKDCHVASLFPDGPWLDVKDALTVTVVRKETPQPRVSLTFSGLARTKRLYLLIIGKEKLQALRMLQDKRVSVGKCPGKELLKLRNSFVLAAI
ncbi:MAG: 6-phosphogluconolactonase [Nitrospirae bacterium]|nr:MAG: 6-phosphogluconolactonase [Nitrospirota bacterium]